MEKRNNTKYRCCKSHKSKRRTGLAHDAERAVAAVRAVAPVCEAEGFGHFNFANLEEIRWVFAVAIAVAHVKRRPKRSSDVRRHLGARQSST